MMITSDQSELKQESEFGDKNNLETKNEFGTPNRAQIFLLHLDLLDIIPVYHNMQN